MIKISEKFIDRKVGSIFQDETRQGNEKLNILLNIEGEESAVRVFGLLTKNTKELLENCNGDLDKINKIKKIYNIYRIEGKNKDLFIKPKQNAHQGVPHA